MLTEEEYGLAKEGINDKSLSADEKAELQAAVTEYEASKQEPVAAASAAPEQGDAPPEPPAAPDASAQVAEILGKDYGPPAPEAPEPNYIEPGPAPYGPPESPDVDSSLPNASKLVRLKFPTDHASKSRSALGVIAQNMAVDQITGPSSTMYFEPSREKFQTDMGPYLEAKGIAPGSREFENAYQIYQDTKWKEAYQNAVINDLPITRAEFAHGDTNWHEVENYLGKAADMGAAFAEGAARGYAGPARGLVLAGRDLLTGRDDVGAMRERAERHPYIGTAGAMAGSLVPGSLFGKVAGKVNALAKPVGMAGKLGMAALGGAATADADLLTNVAGSSIEDLIAGKPVNMEDVVSELPQKALLTTAVGAGSGLVGELVAGGAGALRKYLRSAAKPSLPNAEATGSTTSLVSGVKPSEQVRDILEKARGPVPGEARGPIMETAVEHAAAPVLEPIINQQNRALSLAKIQAAGEKQRYVDFDPVLKNQTIEPTNVMDALFDEMVRRSKPTASAFPSPGDEVGAWDTNKKLFDTYAKLSQPAVHLATEVPPGALRGGSKIISVAQARELGFDIQPPNVRQAARPSRPPPPDIAFGTHSNPPDSETTLKIPAYHPENAFVVELKPIKMSPLKFESVVESIDDAGNASSVKGAREKIWDDLIAVARKDRDKFKNGEWSRMHNRHDELFKEIKQRGKYAGIVEEAPYDKMSPGNRQVAEQTIKSYGNAPGQTNKALAQLADVAGRVSAYQAEAGVGPGQNVRHDLEGIRAVRGYLDLKDKTSLASGLTSGGGPLGLGGLLPAGKIRLDAIARALARDTQGNPLYVPPYNPEAAMGSLPPGRSLLPSAGLFGVGGGALGVRAGVGLESATNDERARSTGSLDAEQMRIIDEALRQHKR
jgi:hypothetical protein